MSVDLNGKKLPKGITQRKSDLRYRARIQFRGERYDLSDKDLRKLQKKILELRYELEHGIYAKESDITVDTWFKIWIEEYMEPTVKVGTYEAYSYSYQSSIKKSIGKKKLRDIRPDIIQKLYNDLKKAGYKRNSLEVVRAVLNGMFKQAFKNRLIRENPVALATLPRVKNTKKPRVMTLEEQKIFLEYSKDSWLYDMFVIALSTGMRSGELRALEWSDIDWHKKVIHVTGTMVYSKNIGFFKDTPKTPTSERDIPLLDMALIILRQRKKMLQELRVKSGGNWKPKRGLENLVFPNTETSSIMGTPLTRMRIASQINLILDNIEKDDITFEKITPHTFRHSFATRCIENGMSPQVLKTILGHSKLSITMDLYAHVLPNTQAEEMLRIADIF